VSRITLVTPYFWPEVVSCVPLMASLAEDLVAQGYEVSVFTSAPVHWDNGREIADDGQDRVPLREGFGGAEVRRTRNPFPRRPGARAKMLEYAWFSAWVCWRVLTSPRADAIYVYSNPPLLGLPVAWLARLGGTPVLYNLQDLFPESAVVSGLVPAESRIVGWLRRLERRAYGAVREIAAISEEFAAHVKRTEPGARVRVIPNWIDTEAVHPVDHGDNAFRREAGLEGKFAVVYSGNLGFVHGLEALVDAAEALRDIPDVAFVIVGEGQQKAELEALARERGLENCAFFGYQSYARIPQVYSAGDVCVVPMRHGASGSSVPSKTWSIMACARPVVACIDSDSELARLLAEEDAGVVVEPENGAALAAAILALRADPPRAADLGAHGRRYVERNLSRRAVTQLYVEAIEELTGEPRPASRRTVARSSTSPVSSGTVG
jgi:colanic acid biosynthesis glycosyl transferase WcaI